jgi:hypothetical protein
VEGNEIGEVDREALRFYIRLTLSYGDFKHAYRASQHLLAQHEDFAKVGGDDLVLRALYSSLVVAYARPFNSSGSSRYGRIPPLEKELYGVLSEEELGVHHYLLHCRNRLVAHTDANAADPDVFVATDLPKAMVIPMRNDTLAPFTAEFTSIVLKLTEKVYRWSVTERYRVEPKVVHLLERRELVTPDGDASGDGA